MPEVSIDLAELSGVTPGVANLKDAVVWFYPYRPYGAPQLVTTDKVVVDTVGGVASTFLPQTPTGNGVYVEIRRVRLPESSRKFIVAIPAGDCNLFDLPHLDPTTLDPAAPLDPAWLATLNTAVPLGGTTGQVLAKASDADHDDVWVDQTGGGGGGAVSSVNTKTGAVVINPDDLDDTSTAHKFVTAAEKTKLGNLSGTNTGDQDLSGLVPTTRTVNGHALSANVTVTKSDVGLGSVDNTADTAKPVSTAQATADTAIGTAAATDATTKANAAQAFAIQRGNHTGSQAESTITGLVADLAATEKTVNKNATNGYAGLDGSGKVAAAQLPAYVDDVLEFANLAAFPATGATGTIYVADDTGKVYRWSGSAYIEISPSPGSTDAVAEGSTNLYYTQARADARVVAGITGKADVASPTFTGDPKAPTAAPGDNDTTIATTAFVTAADAAVTSAAATDATNKVATETSRATTAEGLLAPKASPAFTGNPTAPTPTAGDSDTSIATTAFVTAADTAVTAAQTAARNTALRYTFIGDSGIAGNQDGSGYTIPNLIGDALGVIPFNLGQGGYTSTEAAITAGAVNPTFDANTIPASGPVTLTLAASPGDLRAVPTGVPYSWVASLAGINGNLVRNSTTGVWTFTRFVGGSSTPVPQGAAAHCLTNDDKLGDTTIILVGRNNYTNPTQVLVDVAAIVARLTTTRYLVLSVWTTPSEVTGNAVNTAVLALNASLSSTYGTHYVDMRSYMVTNGLSFNGLTATGPDTTAIAGNTVPPSLIYSGDNLHPNQYGYRAITKAILDRLVSLGYAGPNWSPLSKSAARANLDLGTAALVNTGTTTGTVPVLGASGTVAVAQLATGTPDGTKFIRDDGTLVTPAGGSGITVNDEGTPLATAATTLDFVGSGVVASGTGATKTITIAGGGGTALTVQDEGTPLTTDATTINFTGAGVTATGATATKVVDIPGPLYPRHLEVTGNTKPQSSSTTVTIAGAGGYYYGVNIQAGNSVNNYMEWEVGPVDPGTWTLRWVYAKQSNSGIVTVSIDGSDLSPTVDQYNSTSLVQNATEFTGLTIGSGRHLIRFRVLTKNASSSAYSNLMSGFSLTRTGP